MQLRPVKEKPQITVKSQLCFCSQVSEIAVVGQQAAPGKNTLLAFLSLCLFYGAAPV